MRDFLEAAAEWGEKNNIAVSFRREALEWYAQLTLYDERGPWKTRLINAIPREEVADPDLGRAKSGQYRQRPENDGEYFPRVGAFLSRELAKARTMRLKRFGNAMGSGYCGQALAVAA